MTEIRALRSDDLSSAVELLDSLLPEWGGDASFLEATLLDHPWAEPEIGSLVALDDDGAMIGFIGAHVRRLRFNERELRGVCCSNLVVRPDRRAGAAGALLLGRLLSGAQDLTWSDSANAAVVRMWRMYGGQLDHPRACDWMIVLRPAGWIRSLAGAGLRRRRLDRSLVPVAALPFHAVSRRRRRTNDPDVHGEPATPAEIADQLPVILNRSALHVAHDADHLEHLFGQIRATAGDLVCRLVRRRGRPIGWYAYLPSRTVASRVLAIATAERHAEAVLADLLEDARGRGAFVVAGRLEPHLDGPLRSYLPVIGIAREPVLHTRDPELRAVLATDGALLTRLDSEWFLT